MMKINASAVCTDCNDGMGKPIEVVEEDKRDYTLYRCVICDAEWLRPHNA